MVNRKLIVLAILLVGLLAFGTVSAADNSTGDIVGAGDSTDIIEGDSILDSSNNNENILKANEESFAQLNQEINGNSNNEIYLNDGYKYSDADSNFKNGIEINRDLTIYGNNHTIDGNGESRIFNINGGNVVFYNITFTNGSADKGGAIYSEGSVTAIGCTFTGNTAKSEKGGAIYNHEGALKIANSRFNKNEKYDRAIYNYGTEDNPFILTIINTTMIEDKVCVNYEDNERKLDDKRDIDLLTTEVNAYISEVIYEGNPVLISVSGIDTDFTGSMTVNITNTIYNTMVDVANGEGSTTLNLDINRYTARLKNFISLTEDAFERDDTKPYLEINFKVACNNSFTALEDMISKATDNVTLSQDYIYDSKTDSSYLKISDKTLTIYGNGHSINGNTNNGDTLFLIEDDADVRMENLTLENGHAQSRSHLGSQIRMGGAIFVSRSTLTIINSTLKNNEAKDGSGEQYIQIFPL